MAAKRKEKHKWLDKPMKRREKYKHLYDNIHRVGKPPAFECPEDLLELAMEYFEWRDKNPWQEAKVCSFQGQNEIVDVPKKIPYTFIGLSLYCGCSQNTLSTYRAYPGYSTVFEFIDDTIRSQKFEGAAAGFFNHAIIARDLGLGDDSVKVNVIVNNNPEQQLKDRGIPLPDMGTTEDLEEGNDA